MATQKELHVPYQLLSRYYELKVNVGIAARVYQRASRQEDKQEALELADKALAAYVKANSFMTKRYNPALHLIWSCTERQTSRRTTGHSPVLGMPDEARHSEPPSSSTPGSNLSMCLTGDLSSAARALSRQRYIL